MAKPIHVVPHGDQWAWRREGSERVSGLTDRSFQAPRHSDAVALLAQAISNIPYTFDSLYCGKRKGKRQPPSPTLRRDLGLVKPDSAPGRLGQWRWRIDDLHDLLQDLHNRGFVNVQARGELSL